MRQPKILIATGGTGGHIFPAEALATELIEKGCDLLFVGGGLHQNRYFNRNSFPYWQIESATPFKLNFLKSLYRMGKGFFQSLKILRSFQPDLVIGFGSFYSFPILSAARWKKIPITLFESNVVPGRVNRFFSKSALFSAVQFSGASQRLSGKSVAVKMPMMKKSKIDPQTARDYFYLDPSSFTFLVFGGSQGAESINRLFSKTIQTVQHSRPFQVIHVTGRTQSAERIRREYELAGIRSCVKSFEERMDIAWSAADAVICRSGAAAVAEQSAFGVPGLFIPFPQATDDHQMHNALFVEKEVGGAITCLEASLTVEGFRAYLERLMDPVELQKMKDALYAFQQDDRRPTLSNLILDTIKL
jgi:UDP-N-acetylglucosamine--N-acetylmuramyl-(pentapeptide) pyrophosphoryl-undecaprenol N-acetylglucosamine transferase